MMSDEYRGTITFDTSRTTVDANGNTVPALDETVSGNSFIKAALHELGHSMGLGENVVNTSQSCGRSSSITLKVG
jgi:hypothetical protein